MKLGYLAFKNMISKPLNLIMSLMLLSLSVSLVTFVLQVSQQLEGQLNKNIAPFDMVVGAKGSPLQLVLSSVLHIDNPTGNIKLNEIGILEKHPFVKTAIPVSYGDNFKGYRILGTKTEFLTHYDAELSEGSLYSKPFEVVAGSTVAERLDLNVDDTFSSSHGLVDNELDVHDEHPFMVKGILKPTGTVIDQLLITNLESIWQVHNHGSEDITENVTAPNHDEDHDDHNHNEAHDHNGEHNHDDHDNQEQPDDSHEHGNEKEITSLLIKFKSPLGMVQLPRFVNENTSMQAALPGFEVQRLMGLLGAGAKTINGIDLAILFVSALSIFISLLKTIRERRQEMALLRTYGLRTRQLLNVALLEGVFLAFLGFIFGWLLGRLGVWGASQFTKASYGYTLQINGIEKIELFLLGIIVLLTIIATFLASQSIFKLNIAKTLSDA